MKNRKQTGRKFKGACLQVEALHHAIPFSKSLGRLVRVEKGTLQPAAAAH
jgi:hypothetical protein